MRLNDLLSKKYWELTYLQLPPAVRIVGLSEQTLSSLTYSPPHSIDRSQVKGVVLISVKKYPYPTAWKQLA